MSAGGSSNARGGDWNRRDMTLHDANKYMLEKDDSHDVIFKVRRPREPASASRPAGGEGEEAAVESTILPAHMYVLRSRCPALAGLVEDERAKQSEQGQTARGGKGQQPAATTVEIDDVTAPALNEVLRYLYYEKKDLNQSNSFDVLNAARKYNIIPLEKHCFSYIFDSIDDNTVCPILNRALDIHDEALILECTDYVSRRTEEVLTNPSFLRATEKVVARITSLDQLTTKEIDLFTHCVQWARGAASDRQGETHRDDMSGQQLRKVMAPILHNIRFPTMTMTDFRMQVVPLNILDPYETVDVYNYRAYTGPKERTPNSQFKTIPRGKPAPRTERRPQRHEEPRRDAEWASTWRDEPRHTARETPRRSEEDPRSPTLSGPTHSRVLQYHAREREAAAKSGDPKRPTSHGMPTAIYQNVYVSPK